MNHIIALSGGKDSTALALRLNEVEPKDYIYICTPTGDELPEMEEHWNKLEKILGKEIIRLKHPKYDGLNDLIEKEKCLPNFRRRFCTRILKIETSQMFYEENEPCTAYVGLRADEKERVGIINFDSVRYPLREWGWKLKDVKKYLNEKGIDIPKRTDCARCFYQKKSEWWELWKEYPEIYADAEKQEEEFGHTFLTNGKFGKNFPYALKDIRKLFEKGYTPRKVQVEYPIFNIENDERCRACTL